MMKLKFIKNRREWFEVSPRRSLIIATEQNTQKPAGQIRQNDNWRQKKICFVNPATCNYLININFHILMRRMLTVFQFVEEKPHLVEPLPGRDISSSDFQQEQKINLSKAVTSDMPTKPQRTSCHQVIQGNIKFHKPSWK